MAMPPMPRSRLRAPTAADFHSSLHDDRVVARLGVWLGLCLSICFLTGLVSHYQQHPVGWLPIGPNPAWGYRVTQGLHIVTGTATLPLLLAKLHSVYPRLFDRPLRSLGTLLEKLSIAVLIAATSFQLITGLMNVAQWYPWGFGFTGVHHAAAWLVIGGLLVHIAVKLPIIRRALAASLPDDVAPPAPVRVRPGRRDPAGFPPHGGGCHRWNRRADGGADDLSVASAGFAGATATRCRPARPAD